MAVAPAWTARDGLRAGPVRSTSACRPRWPGRTVPACIAVWLRTSCFHCALSGMPIQGFQLVFRADSGCSPIRMTAADCCNGDMSNANNNPQGGSAAGSAEPQSQPRPPMYQPQPNRGNRFFAWIRSSRITRGRNRWIAGVCDGVARRLGWNATRSARW